MITVLEFSSPPFVPTMATGSWTFQWRGLSHFTVEGQ